MNVDGNIFADLKRGHQCERLCVVVSGDAGSGKSTVIRRVVGAAHNAGWNVQRLEEPIEGRDQPCVLLADYHSVVKQLSLPWTMKKESVVVIDDLHVVWQLLSANGHQQAAQRLIASCPCSLLVSSIPDGFEKLVQKRSPTTVYNLSGLSTVAVFRLLSSLPNQGKGWATVCERLASLVPRGTTYSRLMEVVSLSASSTDFGSTFQRAINPALQGLGSASRLPLSHRAILERLGLLCRLHVADALGTDRGASLVGRTRPPSGILLHGASGTGKTALLAQLEMDMPGVTFMSATASSLFGKYLGESESKLRSLFSDARLAAPCVLVIDDIDVLGQRRSLGDDSGSDVTKRVLTALLCELDGFEEKRGVLVVGTTSVIGTLDGALLRQGRLETTIEVPLVSTEDCADIANEFLSSIDSLHRLTAVVEATENRPLSQLNAVLKDELERSFGL